MIMLFTRWRPYLLVWALLCSLATIILYAYHLSTPDAAGADETVVTVDAQPVYDPVPVAKLVAVPARVKLDAVDPYPAAIAHAVDVTTVAAVAEAIEVHAARTPELTDPIPDVRAYVLARAEAEHGWVGGELDALAALLGRESYGGDPLADNPRSTAFGIFQFLKNTAKIYGIDHPDLNKKIPDVESQTTAGLQYIADRYGTPSAALSFHRRIGWY